MERERILEGRERERRVNERGRGEYTREREIEKTRRREGE